MAMIVKKKVRDVVLGALGEKTAGAGFVCKSWPVFRCLDDKIELVDIKVGGERVYSNSGLPPSSFSLEAGIFLKSVPHPMGAKFSGIEGFPVNSTASCHVQLLFRPGWQFTLGKAEDFWYVDRRQMLLKRACLNAAHCIDSLALSWFKSMDSNAVLKWVRDGGQPRRIGGGHLVVVRSPLLVAGFLSFQEGEWGDAISNLRGALALTSPSLNTHNDRAELLFENIREEIDEAIGKAEHNLAHRGSAL